MAKAVQLHDLPRVKRGLPEYPKFIIRTERVFYGRHGKWKANWLCKCGKEFEALVDNVARLHTTCCGCDQGYRQKSKPIHGHFVGDKPSPTYKSWQAMIARCTNPKHPAFHRYGGRGITICDQWLKSFPLFLADVGERPAGLTLDRIATNGNYEPENCRWATRREQAQNRNIAAMASVGDLKFPVYELCKRYRSEIWPPRVASRLSNGWSLRDALMTPLGPATRLGERKCVFAPLGAS